MSSNLQDKLSQNKSLEEKLEVLSCYQAEAFAALEEKPLTSLAELKGISTALSQLAEEILQAAQTMAAIEMRHRYGLPRLKDNDGQYLPSHLAIIGMGKLGARELNFGSDLDVIFVFEKNGNTEGGEKQISNQEYFTKLVQRIINYLGLPTRRGKLYQVDTELRPSGQAGALVTPLEAWLAYYQKGADFWEHQALLKARLLFTGGSFSKAFEGLFRRLIFLKPFPSDLAQKIHHLRIRIEKELAQERQNQWDFKKGYGGLLDIEFAIQYLQLRYGNYFPQVLQTQSMDALLSLKEKNLISQESVEVFQRAYLLFRRLEKVLRWDLNLKETHLNLNSPNLAKTCEKLKLDPEDFKKQITTYRQEVREHYKSLLKIFD